MDSKIYLARQLIARWDADEGKPYKGSLIDHDKYDFDGGEPPLSCMCAQGQVLHLIGGWEPERLRDSEQSLADRETAKLLNISAAHAMLLRNINDTADGAPSIVLADPGKVLGGQWSKLLDFWWALDQFDEFQWAKVATASDAAEDAAEDARDAAEDARDAAGDAAWAAARAAAEDAAQAASRAAVAHEWQQDAAWDAAWGAVWDAARAAAWAAEYAAGEIQGSAILLDQGKPLFFLPMFGFADPQSIPPRPADYGLGLVPA